MIGHLREITFEITNRCDLRCRICHIWKERAKVDLSLNEIEKILELIDTPLTISLTGGEPFISPYMDEIYRYLFNLFLRKKIKKIDIATNAYSNRILKFLKDNKKYLDPLSLSISIDGIEAVHNKQRGRNDAFEKLLKNILAIKKFNIPVTLKFVISKLNYKDIFKVYVFSKKLGHPLIIKCFEYVKNYYHRKYKSPLLALNKKERLFVKEIIEKIYRIEQKKDKNNLLNFSLQCLIKFLNHNNLNFIQKCLTPEYSLFITSGGYIYNCIYQNHVGRIRGWPSLAHKRYERIKNKSRNGNCPKCLSYHGYLKEFNI